VTKQANPRFSVHLSDSDSDIDAPLVRRAAAGDERAMRLLWERHRAHVDAVVRRLVDDADQAADVAQEVWVQIFRALPSWRGEARFGTWLHRVAVNRTLNAVRALRMQRGLSQGDLAVVMGVSRQTINSIEKERYTPSLPLAIALARYFGKQVEEVFHADSNT